MNSCQREPLSVRTRSSRSGSTSRSPRAVVSTIGKKQMANAITVFGPMPYLNHTMISGPNATFGIMLRLTSSGMTTISSERNQENSSAAPIPKTTARMKPPKISVPVTAMFSSQR